ncbi:MAG: Mo-dependent nitrogenase C-terminal domain-containing protein [Oculatellaceae cyanobacterium Prado106]|jgi:hypothetical protein|nr:Mo-dependent nitrogenase C-terminal domain-containing protein [Oculatellaceae cyanobacterium Prado106]
MNCSFSHSFTSPLQSIRHRVDSIEICNPQIARTICKLIPTSCPFARTIEVGVGVDDWSKILLRVSIPPLCKLNPLYDQLMTLRFRALTYLADQCGEDIAIYC